MPFQPSPSAMTAMPWRSMTGVASRSGTLGDFVACTHGATQRGIRVLIALVVHHTSNEHPWFQDARRDPTPGTWTWDRRSQQKPPRANEDLVFRFAACSKATWSDDEQAPAWDLAARVAERGCLSGESNNAQAPYYIREPGQGAGLLV
jgi:maltose alpha-D-glucosyltransferase/alpha-amylase